MPTTGILIHLSHCLLRSAERPTHIMQDCCASPLMLLKIKDLRTLRQPWPMQSSAPTPPPPPPLSNLLAACLLEQSTFSNYSNKTNAPIVRKRARLCRDGQRLRGGLSCNVTANVTAIISRRLPKLCCSFIANPQFFLKMATTAPAGFQEEAACAKNHKVWMLGVNPIPSNLEP